MAAENNIMGALYGDAAKPSFFESIVQAPATMFDLWKKGVSTPEGQAAVAPMKFILSPFKAAQKIVDKAPENIDKTFTALPMVAGVAGVALVAFLLFKSGAFNKKKEVPQS